MVGVFRRNGEFMGHVVSPGIHREARARSFLYWTTYNVASVPRNHRTSRPFKMYNLPENYLERVYAGVLGKLIGVYLGRPFEGYFYEELMEELGPIKYYVHDKMKVPLVVTDDDVSGTFVFIRALQEHEEITSENIGKTWLNTIVDKKSILWFGGLGISTEQTAFHNLRNGIPAPRSGSMEVNGKTVAEQIGAQIFIDGWGLVSPGQPARAAKFAEAAGKVSHDGESVYAAMLWAAMEAEAFNSTDLNHLIDTGLSFIPSDCLIARVIAQVRAWVKEDGPEDWLKTRQRIDDEFGYHKFCGTCHVIPNHCIMIMALLNGGHDFDRALEIINTCGWDTDCNSGNLGCLVAIMHGMDSFNGQDWRGPLADRALISSADNGYSLNNAARIAYDVTNMGRRLAGKAHLPPPKQGAQFHFALPGSVQGFQSATAKIYQENGTLVIETNGETEVMAQTSAPKEVLDMLAAYPLCSSPLVYPGQTVRAAVQAEKLQEPAVVAIRLKYLDGDQKVVCVDSEHVTLQPGDDLPQLLEWTIPDTFESRPISEIGLVVSGHGIIKLDSLGWTGEPNTTLRRPSGKRPDVFWSMSWIQSVTESHNVYHPQTLRVAQEAGEGMVSYGTREWKDYSLKIEDFIVMYGEAGVAIRIQGLNRYYAMMFRKSGTVELVKAHDEKRTVLASAKYDWALDDKHDVELKAVGARITGRVGSVVVEAEDSAWADGAMGCILISGALQTGVMEIQPAKM